MYQCDFCGALTPVVFDSNGRDMLMAANWSKFETSKFDEPKQDVCEACTTAVQRLRDEVGKQ